MAQSKSDTTYNTWLIILGLVAVFTAIVIVNLSGSSSLRATILAETPGPSSSPGIGACYGHNNARGDCIQTTARDCANMNFRLGEGTRQSFIWVAHRMCKPGEKYRERWIDNHDSDRFGQTVTISGIEKRNVLRGLVHHQCATSGKDDRISIDSIPLSDKFGSMTRDVPSFDNDHTETKWAIVFTCD